MENQTVEEYKKRSREFEMNEARKGLIAHTIVITIISAVLAMVNLMFTTEVFWFVFPAIGMSVGVAVHYIFGVRLAPRFIDDRERRIENWR